eukprot:gene10665-19415_t
MLPSRTLYLVTVFIVSRHVIISDLYTPARGLERLQPFEMRMSENGMQSAESLRCPRCEYKSRRSADILSHLEKEHHVQSLSCPYCNLFGFRDGKHLIEHAKIVHDQTPLANEVSIPSLQCPKCDLKSFKDADELLRHCEDDHTPANTNTVFIKISHRIRTRYQSVALPFPQGEYVGGPLGGTNGGLKWHQGKKRISGRTLMAQYYLMGVAQKERKMVNGLLMPEDLKIGPNVFDILDGPDSAENGASDDDIDVYFSYSVTDSPTAIKNNETTEARVRYMPVLDKLCDPRNIMPHFWEKGLKIGERKANTGEELKKTAIMMKKAKVFVACISDQYVGNNQCWIEFQCPKTTLGTPIVPLVVGDGSFDWTLSVVGMLIAGELYIHLKDRTVENDKLTELLQAMKAHFW